MSQFDGREVSTALLRRIHCTLAKRKYLLVNFHSQWELNMIGSVTFYISFHKAVIENSRTNTFMITQPGHILIQHLYNNLYMHKKTPTYNACIHEHIYKCSHRMQKNHGEEKVLVIHIIKVDQINQSNQIVYIQNITISQRLKSNIIHKFHSSLLAYTLHQYLSSFEFHICYK